MNEKSTEGLKRAAQEALAEKFESMNAQGDVWISTIAAAKLCRASLPAPQQATPSRFGSPDLQALIVQHATQQATPEPVGEPTFAQLKQILDGLDRCHARDSKAEFLRTWIRDWTQHKHRLML